MWLVLARHGHAGRKDQWSGDDGARPLDARGRRQASHLAKVLEPLGPIRLISSPALRCTETLDPLARQTGISVELDDALVPDADQRAVLDLITSLSTADAPSGTVVCSHGEVLGSLLVSLMERDHLKLARRPPGSKGCAWVLEFDDGRLRSSRYIAPGR
jgi:phosphohistidine phosphatase SixA